MRTELDLRKERKERKHTLSAAESLLLFLHFLFQNCINPKNENSIRHFRISDGIIIDRERHAQKSKLAAAGKSSSVSLVSSAPLFCNPSLAEEPKIQKCFPKSRKCHELEWAEFVAPAVYRTEANALRCTSSLYGGQSCFSTPKT